MITSLENLTFTQIDSEKSVRENWDKDSLKKAKFAEGYLSEVNLGNGVEVYVHPKSLSVKSEVEGEEVTTEVHQAYAIRCKAPVTYGKLIDAAEKQEYDVEAGEMEAINRKGRQDPEDPEVKLHDDFIAWIKEGLHKIGWK